MTDTITTKSQEEWLRWLGKEARGFYDPVCPDEAGDACLWALAEIERLRGALRSLQGYLGDDLGSFRRAEDIDAFLRGERVDWLSDPPA